jgi:hypothetical protein
MDEKIPMFSHFPAKYKVRELSLGHMFSRYAITILGVAKQSLCSSMYINLLKLSGFVTYHQVYISKILHGARFALSVLCGYQNRQRFLLYALLTDWLL